MDTTPESLFVGHLAGQTESEDGQAAEAAAFEALLEENPEHAEALKALRADHGGLQGLFRRNRERAERDVPVQGRTIGDFRLMHRLGQGGMGEVWEAEQISLSRRVALKLLAPELTVQRGTDFFSREARAGARLNHPGIIAVLGAGEDDGAHWIAMELVEGGYTLSGFLKELRAEKEVPEGYYRDVTGLVAKVADAMEVAHEAGIIHRDLKPANVLITDGDVPKVGDFGLARLVDENSISKTGDFAGTYYYMSPEQVAARRMGLDHRTDIFSLGVVLYELLTLVRPFEGDTTHQIAQKIMLHDPRDPRTLRSKVPDELTVICAKAMEKDPEERYPSMAELAADLRRYKANEPILAKPPGTLRRASKWAKRNPTKSAAGSVAAAGFVAISALAWQLQLKTDEANESARQAEQAAVGMAVEKQRAEETAAQLAVEKQEAEEARDEAERVAHFQGRMLGELDAFDLGQTMLLSFEEGITTQLRAEHLTEEEIQEKVEVFRELALRAPPTDVAKKLLYEEILDHAGALLDEGFEDDPQTEAVLRFALAEVYEDLGAYKTASLHQEQGLEAYRSTRGDEHPGTLAASNKLGNLLQRQGKLTEAEPHYLESLTISRRTLGEEHPRTLCLIGDLGLLYAAQGKEDKAEPLYREAMGGRRRVLGDLDPDTLVSIMNMGYLLRTQGDLPGAVKFARESLEGQRQVLGDEHRDTLISIANLGVLMVEQGNLEEGGELLSEAVSIRRRVLGDEHPDTLMALYNQGFLLSRQGKLTEAEPLLREVLESRRRVLGETDQMTSKSMASVGFVLYQQGKAGEAEPYFRSNMEVVRLMRGDEHRDTLHALNSLGTCLKKMGNNEEAEVYLREALAGQRRVFGDGDLKTRNSMANLVRVFQAKGELEEAEALASELLELTPTGDPRHAGARELLDEIRAERSAQITPSEGADSAGC